MQIVGLNWHLYEKTHSPYVLALLGASRIIPVIAFALLGGALVDAHNRKKILYITQVMQAILAFSLAFLTWKGLDHPLALIAINILLVSLYTIDSPARQAMMPSLVKREHFGNAVSLGVIGYNISTVAGPAIGGFLIASIGVGSLYAIDAATFIILLVMLTRMKASGAIESTLRQPVSAAAIMEGLRFVKSKTLIWSTMILDFFATFFGEASVLLPVFAKDILHGGPQLLGILYAAPFVGATIMGVIASHVGKALHTGKALFVGIIFYAVGTIIFGLSTNAILSLIALGVIGAGDGLSAIIRNIIRQMNTPDHIRGRMTAINMMFYMGGPRLGEIEAGIVAGLFGAPISVVIGGIGTLIVISVMAITIPQLRTYKDE